MSVLVALGPGDPSLVPAASLRELQAAAGVRVEHDEPLADWLAAQGVPVAEAGSHVAVSGPRLRRLLRRGGWDATVPTGAALEALLVGGEMAALWELTATLRARCPWDRQQTARTIVPHTVEEAYEVAEAAGRDDDAKLLDELGDLLFQTSFLALLLTERGAGDWADVAAGIHAKLVRRHPHVFGDVEAETAGAVRKNWEQIKADQEGREGIFHDVPEVLPALLYARKIQRRASAVGFDWHAWDGAWGDLLDETRELREALDAAPAPRAEHEPDAHAASELGDLLFAAVNVARLANVDPELELRAAAARFRERVERAAELAGEAGERFAALDLEAQDAWYRRAKEQLSTGEAGLARSRPPSGRR